MGEQNRKTRMTPKSISTRLFLITLAFITLSNITSLFIISSEYTGAAFEADKDLVFESAKYAKNTFDSFFESLSEFADNLKDDPDVSYALQGSPKADSVRLKENLTLFADLMEGINSIYILGSDGTVHSSGAAPASLNACFPKTMQLLCTDKSEFVTNEDLGGGKTPVLTFALNTRPDSGTPYGSIIIEINYIYLNNYFYLYGATNTQNAFLIAGDGSVLCKRPISANYSKLVKNNLKALTTTSTLHTITMFGVESLACSYKLKFADWTVVRMVPISTLADVSNTIRRTGIIIFAISIVLFSVLSFFSSKWIARPVTTLKRLFSEVERGNLDVAADSNRSDEFGTLFRSFNTMTLELKRLIAEKVDHEKEKGVLEYQVLKAQINPHFLYNTLDSIKWIANMQNAHTVSDMTGAMIKFLKYNLSAKSPITTLAKELDGLNQYLIIQRFRYGDTFTMDYEIDEQALEMTVLHFMLQPIVENSLIHGFDIETAESCNIRIRAKVAGETLNIDITDNGTGINAASLDLLNLSLKENKVNARDRVSSIGLHNIHSRIQLQFGPQYGITVKNNAEGGLTVSVKLPAKKTALPDGALAAPDRTGAAESTD